MKINTILLFIIIFILSRKFIIKIIKVSRNIFIPKNLSINVSHSVSCPLGASGSTDSYKKSFTKCSKKENKDTITDKNFNNNVVFLLRV